MVSKTLKVVITLFFGSVLMVLAWILGGCGSTNPSGTSAAIGPGNSTPAPGWSGPGKLAIAVYFPKKATVGAKGLSALISPYVSSIYVDVVNPQGGVLGSAIITAPPAGGVASATVTVGGYSGPVGVKVKGWGTRPGMSPEFLSDLWVDAMVVPASTTAVQLTHVEHGQGASMTAGPTSAPLSTQFSAINPDGMSYTLHQIFFNDGTLNTPPAPPLGYDFGVKVMDASGVVHVPLSSMNGLTPTVIAPLVNGQITFPMEVPNGLNTLWNRYQFVLNFNQPYGNQPLLTVTFVDTFDAWGNVVPAGPTASQPALPGTILWSGQVQWANDMTPPPGGVGIGIW